MMVAARILVACLYCYKTRASYVDGRECEQLLLDQAVRWAGGCASGLTGCEKE